MFNGIRTIIAVMHKLSTHFRRGLGGVRVIYFNRLENGEIWLLIVYAKAKFDNLPAAFLNKLKEEINNG